jgi:dipeptidyl aminopeptidase/acylaminoacyl peptidase
MKRTLLLFIALAFLNITKAQDKKPLTIDDLTGWNRITERAVSDDGSLIGFVIEPWDGDPAVRLYDSNADEKALFTCATGVTVTVDSRFVIFTIKPSKAEVTSLKLKKTKKEDMPQDMLGIYDVKQNTTDTIMRIKTHKVPSKWGGWLAWQCEPEKDTANSVGKSSPINVKVSGRKENGMKPKNESTDNGFHLCFRNLVTGITDTIKYVTDYIFAAESPVLVCSTTGDEKALEPGVIVINLQKNFRTTIYRGKGKYKQLNVSKNGDHAFFIVSTDEKDKAGNTYSLYYWNGTGNAFVAAERSTPGIPAGWIINENARLSFGEKSQRLFFGTSPEYKIKDTTILDEDRPNVDVWHYAEGKLHTVQVIDKQRDLRNTYMAVYHSSTGKVVQLGNKDIPDIQLIDDGDADKVLGMSNLPYELESMWESHPQRYDIWLVNVTTGSAQKLKENYRARFRASPAGKYLYWYHSIDSSWYTCNISSGQEYRLTTPATLPCYDELNDVPNFADSYPPAGWLKDDKAFLISDRYDIWSLDPDNKRSPVNITGNGRDKQITYRLIDLDYENDFIDPEIKQYLNGFNEVTKGSAFYSIDLNKKNPPVFLTGGDFRLGEPVKAKKGDNIIYTKETFKMFPDFLISDLSFRNSKRLTNANPQQKDFLWGSAELVKWLSLDGREIEGLLFKPEDFDPAKKYPIIVNFYEKSSSGLYSHRIPEAHRSTIDYHYYTSNGYLVFNPDVHYMTGYPGQSAYNCVMPGIMSLIQRGFVDEEHIGAQGHSWGGYQVAYLATRTGLFAAIESGAPVVNMYSAYGGIRWQTGLNRSMQYERQQSRIGATIWEAPYLYRENSPLFATDKVTTPILIMANDQDGHVPWWQGIEYFIALRRLGKKAWLLNYNGEPHWPLKLPNKKDFQIRMSQFFGHFLKGEPMPQWMKEGIPATEKDFTLGY